MGALQRRQFRAMYVSTRPLSATGVRSNVAVIGPYTFRIYRRAEAGDDWMARFEQFRKNGVGLLSAKVIRPTNVIGVSFQNLFLALD